MGARQQRARRDAEQESTDMSPIGHATEDWTVKDGRV